MLKANKMSKKESSSDSLRSISENNNIENRRNSTGSGYGNDSESVSTDENINDLRIKNKERIEKSKPKDFKSEINKNIRYKAYDYLNLKASDYIYSRLNGIHKLMYKWEIEHSCKILPAIDLKQLILIMIHREKEIIEDVIDFKYTNYTVEGCCGCLFTQTSDIPDYYKKIDRISIRSDNTCFNFKLAYENEYNYITDTLGISLDYVIELPTLSN